MAEENMMHANRWGIFEVQIKGPSDGNPFVEQNFNGIFTSSDESVIVNGFYDGDGIYKIRFMPSYEGQYSFVLHASFTEQVFSGNFYVDQSGENNHGPVHVVNKYHFEYADGTSYIPMGTTSYVWHLQDEETKKQTLNSLKNSTFNKMRFCVFPKHYVYNLKDPDMFPYEGTPVDASNINEDNFMDYTGKEEGNDFDKTRFNPEYFRNIEEQIQELGDRGIEADIILFHPYDRWGFSSMSKEEDELYLKYVINRFAAYRNVWWAMANEWDLFEKKSAADWKHLGEIIVENDPYHHLRSIHNCLKLYDHTEDWITHVSYQRIDLYKTVEVVNELRDTYKKPIVVDELGYEGNIQYGWGNLTAEEELRRFYETALRGGYPGHSETYITADKNIWWSHGGILRGESYERIAFLKQLISEVPGKQLSYLDNEWDSTCAISEEETNKRIKTQYLFYYGFQRPAYRDFKIDNVTDYAVEVIDTWNMTIRFAGVFSGKFRIELPGTQYILVRLIKAEKKDKERTIDKESRSIRLVEKHPFVEMEDALEEKVNAEKEEVIETPIEPSEDYQDHEEYVEAVQINEAKDNGTPFMNLEDLFDDEEDTLDQEVTEEHTEFSGNLFEKKEEEPTPFTEELFEEKEEVIEKPSLEFEDLELPSATEDTDDELPIIVTGAIPKIQEPIRMESNDLDEEENTLGITLKEEKKEDTLDIPLFKKR